MATTSATARDPRDRTPPIGRLTVTRPIGWMANVPPPMHLEIDTTSHSPAVKIVGDLDFTTTVELTQRLDDVITMTRRGDLVVDVAGVDFVDSTGMQALLLADRRCRDWGMRMIVRSPSRGMRELLAITGLDAVLTIDASPA